MFTPDSLQNNRFENKEDFKSAFEAITNPLLPFYKQSRKGRLKIGTSGSVYSEDIRQIEGFLRPLWGFGPYLTAYQHPEMQTFYLDGIKSGTNPNSPDYWGEADDYDQRLVEMASLANSLLLAKEATWDLLTEEEQDYLYVWLDQINHHTIPLSNWLFFRILVNLAMKHCGREWNQEQVEADFAVIDSCYIGNGWYYDENPSQMDYYISFAIHYYSLIYYKFAKEEDAKRAEIMKERAVTFAQTFKYWFDEKGEALPFGRSLSYRFSQCAFWTALVFADVEALPWGEIKGIISRHMTNWMKKDIFTSDGLLSVGYHYQNLVMAEGYNAPGSPYWALKSFLLLAVEDGHPFWKATSMPLQLNKGQIAIPEARMVISQTNQQAQAYVAGQIEQKQAHVDAKYSKFVYSTQFGVSVSKGSIYYKQGGFDNCLALAEGKTYYRSKLHTESYAIKEDALISVWKPWENVHIKTTIIPFRDWHVRVHEIKNGRPLHAIEGGFSVPVEQNDTISRDKNEIHYQSTVGKSSMCAIEGFNNPVIQITEPNTNLFFSRSVYPTVEAQLEVGEHRLISLVGGSVEKTGDYPTVSLKNDTLHITYQDIAINYSLEKGEAGEHN